MTAAPPPKPPNDVEPLHWRTILLRVYAEIGNDRVLLIAAGVTYYMLLALVPSLAVIVSVYGLFTDVATVNDQVTLLIGILPPGGVEIIGDQLKRLTSASSTQLSLTLVVSLLIAFWSAGAGIRALLDAMNVAYDIEERRNFLKLNLIALAFTIGAFAAAVLLIATVLVMPALLNMVYLGKGFEWLIRVVAYGLTLIILLVGLDALYLWGPHGKRERWRWATPGAVLAVIGVTIVSVAFSYYAANYSNYDHTYGSLGALVGLLTWIWLSVTIIIIGAELNAEIEKHQATMLMRV